MADSVATCGDLAWHRAHDEHATQENTVMVTRSLVSVVDDDESVRESLPDMLRQFGFAAQAFSSAEAFLASDFVAQTKCLILDVSMPGMTGPDLQRELVSRRQAIPIVFITASGDTAIRTRTCGWRRGVPLQAVQRNCTPRRSHCRASDTGALTRMTTATVTRAPYNWTAVGPPSAELVTMPDLTPIVFVVDDDVSVRESLELLIASAGWRPHTFAAGQDFLSRPRLSVPSCLLLDVSMPGVNGLELQRQLAERTEMPIIVITGHGDVPMTVQAMKAGAVEFLTKPLKHDVLVSAIRDALERSRAALCLDAEMRELRHCYESLTPREREVMARVVSGMLNKQVGGELGISEITVKAHRGQVMRKMKADSLPDLVTMAAQLGLRSTPARS